MFKIEPYVTPLILSYVNKYIKNIKPEDSQVYYWKNLNLYSLELSLYFGVQVSLWGGDAVFHNLDLRLDVLEAELHSPFTFSSGHIHELRIHVPWTKLASEPIVLTINTIECTLKLKNAEDRVSDKSSQSQKTRSKRWAFSKSEPAWSSENPVKSDPFFWEFLLFFFLFSFYNQLSSHLIRSLTSPWGFIMISIYSI